MRAEGPVAKEDGSAPGGAAEISAASARLRIELLGPPQVELDGARLETDTRKATALLAYLAVTARRHRREAITNLLWPDCEPQRGRSALRRTLSTLNRALGGRWLAADRESVALERDGVWLDVDASSIL